MKKYFLTIIGIIGVSFAYAQNNPFVFFGGAGDGFVVTSFTQSTTSSFTGGMGDGFATNNYTQATTNAFIGGMGDGYAANNFLQVTTNSFVGSVGDGYAANNYTQPTTNSFVGGNGDGHAASNYTQPTTNSFKGGVGDGWAAVPLSLVPLPIELLRFSGSKIEEGHLLEWVTAGTENLSGFELERSADSKQYSTINQQNADGSKKQSEYSYIDRAPFVGNNFYRLKLLKSNGNYQYSNTVLLRTSADGQHGFVLYPNPTASLLNIVASGIGNNEKIDITVLDMSGKVVLRTATLGSQPTSINVAHLANGAYLMLLQYQGAKETIRFSKQ